MTLPFRYLASALGTRGTVVVVEPPIPPPVDPGSVDVVDMGGGANMVERSVFASRTPSLPYASWLVPGNGSPAISTSDYYLTNGLYWFRPYDLDTMGSEGATIKAREGGKRYVWLINADHGGIQNGFAGGNDFYVGYSNDPQVYPDPSTMRVLRYANDSITVVDQLGYTQNSFLVYQVPWLVYNPDEPTTAKFYIYAEGASLSSARQHQLALMKSVDLLAATTTLIGPAIPVTNNQGWTSYGRPKRLGVNSWECYAWGRPDGASGGTLTVQPYKYTSTDGWAWTSPLTPVTYVWGPTVTIASQFSMVAGHRPGGPEYLSSWALNSNATAVDVNAPTHISTQFEDQVTSYPWQTMLQDIALYEEDGIASIYITRGFAMSGHDRTNEGPYLGNRPHNYDMTGSITSNVMTVTAMPSDVPPLKVGFRLINPYGGQLAGRPEITSLGTGTGGLGTYNLAPSTPDQAAGSLLRICTNGGLWHQFVDQYYLTTNATTAASAAPLGVRADCSSGVVTIRWNNCLPHQNYRVYRGTTSATQATLVGNVTGTSITDTPTPGAQCFYKVVTMNVTEQKSRVVSVYVSNNTIMVNRHVNRVINDGGDITKINMAFLSSADAWLTAHDAWKYLGWWTDTRFGIKENAGFITKIYDLGATQLPRGGDYTPTSSNTFPSTSSNTSYSATGFRGTTPCWVNNATTAHGYYGNGRINLIQRWTEITLLAAYQKPGTGNAGLFGLGQFGGLYLYHGSGATGTVDFAMSAKIGSNSTYYSATVPFTSASTAHVAGAVFDGVNMIAYLDGVAGTPLPQPTYANPDLTKDTTLRGTYTVGGTGGGATLASGCTSCSKNTTTTYSMDNAGLFSAAGLAVFNKGLPAETVRAWGDMYINTEVDISVAPYNADKTGATDAATKFNDFHTTYTGRNDAIVLKAPAGSYRFSSNLAQVFSKDITNLKLVGAGVDTTTITRYVPSASTYKWGEEGLYQDGLHSAKVQTVVRGATSVTLTTADAAKISRFTAGLRCILAGVDLQASGDPFNNHFFEYLKISSISGTTINFTSAIKENYKDTWPAYNDGTLGGGNGMDQAGAATLYCLRAGADCDFAVQDLTLTADASVGDNLGQNGGRNMLLQNVKIVAPASYAWAPSVSETSSMVNVNIANQIEVDKSIGTFNVVGGYIHKIYSQSSSVGMLHISGGAVLDQVGTVRRNLFENSTLTQIDFGPGYGATESVECNNCTITTFNYTPPSYNISTLGYTCASGIIQRLIPTPQNQKMETWAVPGTWIKFFNASGRWVGTAKILDLWRDATINYVQTNLAGGFPPGAVTFGSHPCANWKGVNNSGSLEAIEVSRPLAQNKPLRSYQYRIYDESLAVAGVIPPDLWGKIVSISVDVQAIYTGTTYPALTFYLSQGENTSIVRADGVTNYSMPFHVNTKILGKRIAMPNSNTGAQTGDLLPSLVTGDMWGHQNSKTCYQQGSTAVTVAGAGQGPYIVVEIICDQGVT